MTLRKIAIVAVGLPILAGFFACNSSYEPNTMTASSAAVKTFSLTKDDSVLAHLDSVFFSIDLVKGLIFNADSLPCGTKVTKLIPVITMLETASKVELEVKRADGTDTTYNYLTNSTDSIDFTNPVTLRVVSYDGLNEMKYTINVNVHKLVSDSLTWPKEYKSELPTALSAPTAQRTTLMNGTYYCLTAGGGEYCMASYVPDNAVTNAPAMNVGDWSKKSVTFAFTPQVESFTSTDDAMYILDESGNLFTSADGEAWTPTGRTWHAVYGRYGDQVLGSVETADGWFVESYPSGAVNVLAEGMPVEGASMPVGFKFPMSASEQIVIVGGRMANGKLTTAAWGYDGSSWIRLSKTSLPVALEGVAVAMYYSFKTSSSWNVTAYPTLIAFGGKDEKGVANQTVYISSDFGYIWQKGGSEIQLPTYIPAMWGAQTFVDDSYYSRDILPMISKPTETWECPYIYMFGGYDASGNLNNSLWRGVINRLSFAPVE